MKMQITIKSIKDSEITLEGVSLSFECSANEVVKTLAGVKALIEEDMVEPKLKK